MLDRKRGYAMHRPFYSVDPNAQISAGMVAFLATSGGVTIATTAASGTVPIGTFWKDHNIGYFQTTIESRTFGAAGTLTLLKGNVRTATSIKVTNAAGTVVYTLGVDFTVNTTNGVVTRVPGGLIAALATVLVWYEYTILASAINFNGGSNYDRQPDDSLGSSKISVAEGDAKIFTDQFDVTQTYTLNAQVRSNALSQWTTAAGAITASGRVISVPTAADPFLGVQQVTVTV